VFVDPDTRPGVWRFADGEITRLRDGWRYADLAAPDEFVLIPNGIRRPIEPGAYLARVIQRGRAAASPEARSLTPEGRALLGAVVRHVVRD
jgi:hypothetical protein